MDRAVLLLEALERGGQLVDVVLARRVERGAVRRRREWQRGGLDDGFRRRDEGVAGVGIGELGGDANVASDELIDLDLLLTALQEEVPEALRRLRSRIDRAHARRQRAGEHLHEREVADEGVGDRLEDLHDEIAVGGSFDGSLDQCVLATKRRRHQVDHIVQDPVDPNAKRRTSRHHRNNVATFDRVVECGGDLFAGELLAVEVFHEQLVVGLGD